MILLNNNDKDEINKSLIALKKELETEIGFTRGSFGKAEKRTVDEFEATTTTFFSLYINSDGDLIAKYPSPTAKNNFRLDQTTGELFFNTDV